MEDFLLISFPVSGVTTWWFLPPLVAFFLAYFGAMAGVTGAFLLLPFQVSVLHYTAPGVSATNFCYNLFAIPGTVFRYAREGRMNWPLAAVITIGSIPGIGLGYYLRVKYLTSQKQFLPFAGLVLLYLAWMVAKSLFRRGGAKPPPARNARIRCESVGWSRIEYGFDGQTHGFDPRSLLAVALAVGVVGGAYGIGGGAVLAPFCISVLRLPIHSVAGASLFGTFMSSIAGVIVYQLGFFSGGMTTQADYFLGAMFGLGGMVGGYLGARTQKYVPERPIKAGLLLILVFVSFRYLSKLFG